ncbi:hypothetical protein SDRG_11196 [Saprolegnia diclina VS20]|uniref:GYF domain-containing protein n=1 Tax=Saprolegnia diclina (strain VS20) TaxID=1156394 RepID=T0PZM1_SAPDV|nr:hypothetical protein SDRG_11196 [Saprolegnia diclina VS20]EQC31009.1 hypothetical protein SDRG_11196 [Saprolegnia diclina VS20]|eukprot:XP_008615448.1 hypothetical protein SDRG_11196 [Saprolegnia diclina VS20]
MKRHGHGDDRGGAKKAKSVQFNAKPSVKYIEDDEEETKESDRHGDDDEDDDEVDPDHVAYESEDSDAEDGKKARPPPIQHKIQEGEEESTTRHDAYEDDGVRMMPFNLKEDREDGHFDDSGNFVWAKGDKAVQEDAWLDGVSAQDMEIAEMARLQRQEAADDEAETWTERRAKSVFMEVLNEGETVLAALRRLGKKPKPKTAKQKKTFVDAQTPDMKREFNQLTDAADYMMRQGHTEIYHKPKEDIVDKPAPKPIVYWEYRAPDGQIQGPYPTATILAWRAQGYFQGDSAVQMRQCQATPAGPAPLAASAAQDLMDDFDDDDEEESKTSEDGWQSSDAIPFRQFV